MTFIDTAEIMPTANEGWGFWGTWALNYGEDSQLEAWEAASIVLVGTYALGALQTRNVLDSRVGRHLANELSFHGVTATAEPDTILDALVTVLGARGWGQMIRTETGSGRA